MWETIKEYAVYLRTDNVVSMLQEWSSGGLMSNPWIIGGFIGLMVIAFLMGWKATAGFMAGGGGFVYALAKSIGNGTGTEGIASGSLWILIGGGAASVAFFIYMLFIRAD